MVRDVSLPRCLFHRERFSVSQTLKVGKCRFTLFAQVIIVSVSYPHNSAHKAAILIHHADALFVSVRGREVCEDNQIKSRERGIFLSRQRQTHRGYLCDAAGL